MVYFVIDRFVNLKIDENRPANIIKSLKYIVANHFIMSGMANYAGKVSIFYKLTVLRSIYSVVTSAVNTIIYSHIIHLYDMTDFEEILIYFLILQQY